MGRHIRQTVQFHYEIGKINKNGERSKRSVSKFRRKNKHRKDPKLKKGKKKGASNFNSEEKTKEGPSDLGRDTSSSPFDLIILKMCACVWGG